MDQYKRVWKSPIAIQKKCLYMNGAVWSRGRWSLHLLHLNKALRDSLDGAQASMLRRIAGIPHRQVSAGFQTPPRGAAAMPLALVFRFCDPNSVG